MLAEFGLKKMPFDKTISESDLMETYDMKEALARFEHLKRCRGIMLLTGDPGTGKTCILRRMVKNLNPQNYHHCYTPHATISRTELYRQLSILFNLPPRFFKTSLYQQIQHAIIDLGRNQGKIPCIILDECHLMDDATLEELVLLTNFEMDSQLPFILVLSGLHELREKLNRRRHEALNQRITFRYHMEGLTVDLWKADLFDRSTRTRRHGVALSWRWRSTTRCLRPPPDRN